MRKIQFYKILFLVSFLTTWTIFVVYYDGAIVEYRSDIEGADYSFYRILFFAIINSVVGGTILGVVEVLVLSKLLRNLPFGVSLIYKTAVYVIIIFIFTSATRLLMYSSELTQPVFSQKVIDHYIEFLVSPRLVTTILSWGFVSIVGLFIIQVSDKFGQGVLVNFLLGRYHSPKEEERIFMFMDLKSSTTYAEKLGHAKYSALIQDCYKDLTDIVTTYNGNIYQYVGDEVVLSWDIKYGIRNGNCIKTFFAYDEALKMRSQYYKDNYSVMPEFKAGLHLGYVMIAEVGEIKKELAFHGDAINTTARIQAMCNKFKKNVLISGALHDVLEHIESLKFDFVDKVKLKGKSDSVSLYDVTSGENM